MSLAARMPPVVWQHRNECLFTCAYRSHQSMNPIESRHALAVSLVEAAAQTALGFFKDRDSLNIEVKGLQDWVSNADKSVEDELRAALAQAYPYDAIVGEEHGAAMGSSGFTWVIDPIDGTTNFVNGTPGWCVVLACVHNSQTVSAVVCDPVSQETYVAARGHGASLNGRSLQVSAATRLDQGTLGVGHSTRISPEGTIKLLEQLLNRQGLFRRGGSGALDLAYVAAGRLIGFVEPHMNAWDCLAAMLLIEEAGGRVEPFDMPGMIAHGGRAVTACPGVYDEVLSMMNEANGELNRAKS